jgi:hypothetical protein
LLTPWVLQKSGLKTISSYYFEDHIRIVGILQKSRQQLEMVCVSKGIPSLQSETKHYLCFPASKLLAEKETPLATKTKCGIQTSDGAALTYRVT